MNTPSTETTAAETDPPYRASLERALADLAQRARQKPGAPRPAPHDAQAMQAWMDRVAALAALHERATPDFAALAEATRPGGVAGMDGPLPDQIMVPFKGVAPFFVRCLAAIAAADIGDAGLLLVDTGTDDAEAARLAAYCRTLGFKLTLARGTPIDTLNRRHLEAAWGRGPRRVILMNNDTIPAPGFSRRLFAGLEARPEIKMLCAATNNPQDVFCARAGFEDGPEETLLARVWRFAEERAAAHAGETTCCPYACFTCTALDWEAWASAEDAHAPATGEFPYDLHVACCLNSAGHRIAVQEDAVIYHMGHATYDERGEQANYERSMRPIVRLIETWGHLPDHFALIRELLYATSGLQR